jgi:DNA polymerase III epsilon subunit-like protein
MSMDVVVLDTETTGIQSDSERIIEIGAIKLRENRPV